MTITAVPEPSTLALFAVAAAAGLAALARHRGVNGSPG
ncbi:MAG: PEP-CTERM sorting domain-containing protein [Pirellulales bacterium]